MCAQTRPLFILSSERVLEGMEFEPMLTPREKSPLLENFPRGGSNPRRCGQGAQTLPTSYSGPHMTGWFCLDWNAGMLDWSVLVRCSPRCIYMCKDEALNLNFDIKNILCIMVMYIVFQIECGQSSVCMYVCVVLFACVVFFSPTFSLIFSIEREMLILQIWLIFSFQAGICGRFL